MGCRVHIMGASGTGTTTLGRALAASLRVPHLDTDDFYWRPTDPPYTDKRPVPERLERIRAAQGRGGWVLSGSADHWGDPVTTTACLIVFLRLRQSQRLLRLKRREQARFGDRIAPGGDMERLHRAFLDWAVSYDDPYFGGRSLHRHLNWLSMQSAPVLELSGEMPTETQVAACHEAIAVHVSG
ncbi:P-loop NTPase family protein [Histidinibacterium aquaticum]|uniref:Adenylate kinase n=1 Tax=Histidinibacterium aquaticum TaxID=2613962 RepID=A0A5J5GKZ3_9RHOB|nr:AAA family ATPase [Histidinibacterium aquaticum]KAA9008969.1 adenylate kinase [Histidinibacterium aquaticum]